MHLGLDRPRSRPRPIRLRRKAPILLQGRQIAFERLCRHPRTAGRAAREISPSSPGASRRAWGNRARFRTSDRAHAVGEGDAPRRRPAVPAAVPPRDPGREAKTDSSPLGSGTLYDKSYLSYKVRFLLAPWYNTLFGAEPPLNLSAIWHTAHGTIRGGAVVVPPPNPVSRESNPLRT